MTFEEIYKKYSNNEITYFKAYDLLIERRNEICKKRSSYLAVDDDETDKYLDSAEFEKDFDEIQSCTLLLQEIERDVFDISVSEPFIKSRATIEAKNKIKSKNQEITKDNLSATQKKILPKIRKVWKDSRPSILFSSLERNIFFLERLKLEKKKLEVESEKEIIKSVIEQCKLFLDELNSSL